MAKIVTPLLLLALLALSPAPSRAQQIDGIAATVNDEVITSLDVEREYSQMQKELEKLPPSEKMGMKNAALNRLVDKKLVEQKIRELDIKVSDDEVRLAIDDVKRQNNLSQESLNRALASQGLSFEAYQKQMKEQLERVRLMSQEVRSKIQVGEREIREYYDANPTKFGADEQYRARQIFFKVDKKGGAAEQARVEEVAKGVLKEAKSGKDFVELAKKYSNDPAAAKDGGDLGTFKRADMLPQIGDTVAALKPGEVSSLVTGPSGLHIIKLEEKSQSAAKPFDEVKGEIEDTLYKKKSDERFQQWVKELHASAAIDIR